MAPAPEQESLSELRLENFGNDFAPPTRILVADDDEMNFFRRSGPHQPQIANLKSKIPSLVFPHPAQLIDQPRAVDHANKLHGIERSSNHAGREHSK